MLIAYLLILSLYTCSLKPSLKHLIRGGKKMKTEGNIVMTFQDGLAVLEVRNVKVKEDSGKYTCTATNKIGKCTHSAMVTVGTEKV